MKDLLECPHCHFQLDDGDVYEKLKETYPEKNHDQLLVCAGWYGWTPENKTRFSKMVLLKNRANNDLYICPECREKI